MPKAPAASTEPDLRQYVAVLLRRKWLIAIIVALAVASALAYSFTAEKVYETRADVLVRGGAGDPIFNRETPIVPVEQNVDSELRILRSGAMRAAVTKDLGYFPEVTTETAEDTPRISLFARDSSPTKAAKAATDYAQAFVRERTRTIGLELDKAIKSVGAEQQRLDSDAAAAALKINDITRELATTTDRARRLELEFQRTRLQSDISTGSIAERQKSIRTLLSELQRARVNNTTRGSFTVASAVVPEEPISPKPVLNAFIALLTGLLLGIGAAFARDFFDDSMRTKEDLDGVTGGLPVLSLIPAVPGWRDRDATVLETIAHPHSAASESYRSLRTALEFAAIEHKIGIIHVTSSSSGEGKTTTAANLAVALASTGKRVVLVDCDLRRPRAHKFFGMENAVGFTSVLVGEVDAQDALQPVESVPGLLVLPSGPRPPNPAELLSTKATSSLLDTLSKFADHVVVDSPPLLPVADSAVLAGYAHATILVVAAKSTSRRSLNRSLELLSQVNAPLEGAVFNGVGSEATYGKGYGYTYGDEDDDDTGGRFGSIRARTIRGGTRSSYPSANGTNGVDARRASSNGRGDAGAPRHAASSPTSRTADAPTSSGIDAG